MRRLSTAFGALAAVVALTGPGAAQDVPPVSVDSDHWVYPLLDRMAADGLLDGVWMPGRRPVGGDAIEAALDSAVTRSHEREEWRATATAARSWFSEEYDLGEGRLVRFLPTASARAADGPRTEPSGAAAGLRAVYRPGGDVGLWASPEVRLQEGGPEMPVPRLGAAWGPGPFRLSASYGAHRLGPGASGGLILHDAAELGWLEVALDEPVRLPWLLRYLGPFQISGAVSRIGADSLGPAVGFVTGEFRLQPFPWVTLGLYRSFTIAREVGGETLDFGNLVSSLLGTRTGTTANFDDQKASMSASISAEILGVTVNPYFVWGWEDTWEVYEDPGAILGVWVPAIAVGGVPVGLRYEFAAIGDEARIIWPFEDLWDPRNWYRHSTGRTVYVDGDGELLGHPLGGYGSEHRLEVDVPLPAHGALVGGALYTRERVQGVEDIVSRAPLRTVQYDNLLYDVMPGRSHGGSLAVSLHRAGLRLDGRLTVAIGEMGWDRVAGSLGATWLLP